jgi:hypothetical protein
LRGRGGVRRKSKRKRRKDRELVALLGIDSQM